MRLTPTLAGSAGLPWLRQGRPSSSKTSRYLQPLLLALVCGLAAGCSDAGLQPVDDSEGTAVDDKLLLTGEVCTSDPTEAVFPVKIMFIVDASGSMQFTDPSDANTSTTFQGSNTNQSSSAAQTNCLSSCTSTGAGNCAQLCSNPNSPGRQAAVQKVINRFKNNPAVEFAIIRFNARVTVNGGEPGCEGFSNKANCIQRGLESLTQAEIFTDYQGALDKAYEVLERDMIDASPIERIRSKYVLVFISDGAPDPQCEEGCGNDEYLGQTPQCLAGIVVGPIDTSFPRRAGAYHRPLADGRILPRPMFALQIHDYHLPDSIHERNPMRSTIVVLVAILAPGLPGIPSSELEQTQ